MSLSASSEVELLVALQAVADKEIGWIPFLSKLAGQTHARFAALIARAPGQDHPTSIISAMPTGLPAPIDEAALAELLTTRMRPERIYATDELAELVEAGSEMPIGLHLDRLRITSLRAMRVGLAHEMSISLGIFGTNDFGAADGAVLRRLFPYVQAQTRIAAGLWRDRFHADMTAALARRTTFGWVLFDRIGTVIDASEDLRHVSVGFRVVPGLHGLRPVFEESRAEAALLLILDRLSTGQDVEEHAVRVSVNPPMYLRVSGFDGDRSVGARQAIAFATLHGESRMDFSQASLLIDLFGLLPSEARFAVALSRGEGLESAALSLGLTIETARYYSKKIFAKTGSRGQADLVRLIFANGLVAALDPARTR